MKNYYITLLLLCSLEVSAQSIVTMQLHYNRPTGDYGFVVEGAPGISLQFGEMILENRFHTGLLVSYTGMPSRNPEGAPVYGVGSSGLVPGVETYSDGYLIALGGYSDFRVLNNEISPVIGITAQYIAWDYDYSYSVPTLTNFEADGSDSGLLVGYSLGIDYIYQEKFKIETGIRRTHSAYGGRAAQWLSSWRPYVSGSFFFW